MYSQVADAEQQTAASKWPVRVFSVAPGIVDTQMQDEIRATPEADFGDLPRFVAYKQNGNLTSPEAVARKLMELMARLPKEVLLDVRQF